MEDNFKIPSLESKIKFIPRKTTPNKEDIDAKPQSSTKHTDENVSTECNSESEKTADIQKKVDKPQKPTSNHHQSKIPPPINCTYIEPKWSAQPLPELQYNFEVLKNGTIVENVKNLQSKSYWLIGKLPGNHIPLAHPTISRYHAVFQYRPDMNESKQEDDNSDDEDTDADSVEGENKSVKPINHIEKGWYLYDLNSSHGSFVNKTKIPPKTYVRVRVGYMIKFGFSTRSFILQGPDFDAEPESELTVTEIKEQRRQRELEYIEKIKAEEKRKEEEGVSWGMTEDADEETDLSHNPFASTNNEELFLNDPKKTLRGFFEREGLDLDYKVDELSMGTFMCRIELPIHDSNGRAMVAEICHKGKKKDCVFQCAMEACRMLDRHGVLRQANHESRKRKIEHSDSDGDDDFYDRTGDVERKRLEKAANQQTNAFSYDELLAQEEELINKLSDIENNIMKYKELEKLNKQKDAAEDDLDDFMTNLTKEKTVDKIELRKLKVEVQHIKNDHKKLQRLINIARPVELPPLSSENSVDENKAKKPDLPLFGKKGTFKFSSSKVNETQSIAKPPKKDYRSDEEEMEDAEEIDSSNIKLDKTKDPPTIESIKEEENDSITSEPIKEDIKIPTPAKAPSEEKQIIKCKSPKHIEMEAEQSNAVATAAAVKKRNRNRLRIRGDKSRENVDYDDAEEFVDQEKYSTWVPPKNQSGDGSTNLNDKYGY